MSSRRWIILLAIALGAAGPPARAGSAAVAGDSSRGVSAPAWRSSTQPADPGPTAPPSRPDADPACDDEDDDPVGFAGPVGAPGTGPAAIRAARSSSRSSRPPASPRPARRPPIRC